MNISHLPNNQTELRLSLAELNLLTHAVAQWYAWAERTEIDDPLDPWVRIFCGEFIGLAQKVHQAKLATQADRALIDQLEKDSPFI
jgi:hypothetical protein